MQVRELSVITPEHTTSTTRKKGQQSRQPEGMGGVLQTKRPTKKKRAMTAGPAVNRCCDPCPPTGSSISRSATSTTGQSSRSSPGHRQNQRSSCTHAPVVKMKRSDVRFGNKEGGGTHFGLEQRFAWQRAQGSSDTMYSMPAVKAPPFSFGTSTRADWKKIMENTKDLHNPNAGPGNYKTGNEFELLSESPSRRDITFGTAPRESMELMTASPGVLYDVNGMFKDGPVKGKILPGFNLDTRKPLSENLKSTTAALYSPKLPSKGGAVWFGDQSQERFQGTIERIGKRSPGPVYDVIKYGGPSGPRFSFGASRRDRWGNMRMPTIV